MGWLDDAPDQAPPGRGYPCPECGHRAWSPEGLNGHRREHGVLPDWEVQANERDAAARQRRRTLPDYERGAPKEGLRVGQVVERRVGRGPATRLKVTETGVWGVHNDGRRKFAGFVAHGADEDPETASHYVFANSEVVKPARKR